MEEIPENPDKSNEKEKVCVGPEKKEKTGKKSKGTKSGQESGEDKAKTTAKNVNILDDAAMENAYNICHNVQDLLYFRLKKKIETNGSHNDY